MIGLGVHPRLAKKRESRERPRFLVDLPADLIVNHHESGRHHILARAVALIVVGVSVIEALLLFRLYAQITSRPVEGYQEWLYRASGVLVSPFRRFELETPIKSTGILEIATLVALEAYLAAALALLTLFLVVWVGGRLVAFFREPRPVPLIAAPVVAAATVATSEPAQTEAVTTVDAAPGMAGLIEPAAMPAPPTTVAS